MENGVTIESRACSGCHRIYATITKLGRSRPEVTRYHDDAPVRLIQQYGSLYVECLRCGVLTRTDLAEWFFSDVVLHPGPAPQRGEPASLEPESTLPDDFTDPFVRHDEYH